MGISCTKYGIDTVLWSVPEEKKKTFLSDINERLESKNMKNGKYGNLASQLDKEGWEVVYRDKASVIFRKSPE